MDGYLRWARYLKKTKPAAPVSLRQTQTAKSGEVRSEERPCRVDRQRLRSSEGGIATPDWSRMANADRANPWPSFLGYASDLIHAAVVVGTQGGAIQRSERSPRSSRPIVRRVNMPDFPSHSIGFLSVFVSDFDNTVR